MKTIGLIGGMSWESTLTYYKRINEVVHDELKGLHSAKIILFSVDFSEIEECQAQGNWKKSGEILSEAALALQRAGVDVIVICTNTMHKVVDQVQSLVEIPILHIADATSNALNKVGIERVALLGTKYTMTQDFYREKIESAGIHVIVPNDEDIELVNQVIYEELCLGVIKDESRLFYLEIIEKLRNQGAQGVILGCTEIGLLIHQEDVLFPLFDTAEIHAIAAAQFALCGE